MIFEMIKLVKNKSELNYFLKSLGFMQGKACVDMQQYFGVPKGFDSFKAVFDFSDISGMGRLIIDPKNENRLFVYDNIYSYYSKFYEDDILSVLRDHFLNLYVGIYNFSYNRYSEFVEVSENEIKFEVFKNELVLLDIENYISKSLTTKTLITNSS